MPEIILSAAMSLDGFIDDASPERLLLSSPDDFAAVDALRADVDAILVGAGTIRADNPRLLVRDSALRENRRSAGRPETPIKITFTSTGELDPRRNFFTAGTGEKWVYVPRSLVEGARDRLTGAASVLVAGETTVDPRLLLRDLSERGVRRVLVEGGSRVNTLFLGEDLVDELRLSVSPVFVGDERAPRFVGPGRFRHMLGERMRLVKVERLGDSAVLHYDLR